MTALSSDDLTKLQHKADHSLAQVTTSRQLEEWRVTYIGRKGLVPKLLRTVKDLPAKKRRLLGQQANELRSRLEQQYQLKQAVLRRDRDAVPLPVKQAVPLTKLSGMPQPGHLHPLTITLRAIQDIFASLGFMVVEGPLVEEPEYNFDLLNIPPQHPTRAETDTFYLTDGHILRTQTSAMQVRVVREQQLSPPFRLLFPGRVFRAERTDATHETTFYQFEGLVVASAISVADLKGTIEVFYSRFFNKAAQVRLRPSYFPFVEPGYEVDLQCVFCTGKGCRICKHTGWLEVMGAGMVHPVVLRNMNIDPEAYSGFAFGGAVDRLAMLQHSIDDIRLFWSGSLDFLKQFS
ncbi:MAG: phenylalanine--tRNA ligase subunit alpha [Candidatus Andersenbacteria bacterium]